MSSRVSPQSRRINDAPISPETTENTAATRSSWAPAQRTVLPGRAAPARTWAKAEGNTQQHRYRSACLRWRIDRQGHSRAVRLVAHPADHSLHGRRAIAGARIGCGYLPRHFGRVFRYTAVDFG